MKFLCGWFELVSWKTFAFDTHFSATILHVNQLEMNMCPLSVFRFLLYVWNILENLSKLDRFLSLWLFNVQGLRVIFLQSISSDLVGNDGRLLPFIAFYLAGFDKLANLKSRVPWSNWLSWNYCWKIRGNWGRKGGMLRFNAMLDRSNSFNSGGVHWLDNNYICVSIIVDTWQNSKWWCKTALIAFHMIHKFI